MKTPLPPDPEEMNEARAEYAGVALARFADITAIRDEDTFTKVQDLLCNLMHLCDRTEGVDFDDALVCARIHYNDETCDDSDPESGTYMSEEDEPSPFDDDSGEVSPFSGDEDPESAPFAAQYWAEPTEDDEPAPLTPAQWTTSTSSKPAPVGDPLKEVLAALDQLLRVTVDNMLSDGIELTEAEAEARTQALAVFEKYGKGGE